ncbi:DNA damage-regulated autophagy modulator protein 1-like [Hyla sarda]|uniref:DNA damage-regulated autophagy modulator protein 1-like n=1 Tax=Hyla sarda TaxID=327740 RepID=UPI0024C45FD3|nr:DNA damage-regulated autophagy modulator protein 1-like [Hyla sarda]
MELKGLGFVPLLLAFWCVAWLATSYIVTVVLGHAASPLMHISDVGNFFPENILLRIGFIGTSIGTLVLTFLIYKYMVMHTEEFRGHQVLIQRILLAIVWASCFGTAVMHVLSPEEYPRIHFVSTIISITCEALYYLGQSIQMYKLPGANKVIRHSRCTCCGLAFTCAIFYFGYKTLQELFYDDEDWDEIREITTIIIEWVMLLLILINIVTYYSTMQRLMLTVSRNSCKLSLRVRIDDFGV